MATRALFNLIRNLQQFDKIIITGAQRSGTTIAMKILADELSYEGIMEEDISIDDISLLAPLLVGKNKFILQAPGLCSIVHLIKSPDTSIVMMKRNVNDVMASQVRIGWPLEEYELSKYFMNNGQNICEIKNHIWEMYQKPVLGDKAFELEYESLKGHPMFIEIRENFGARQTE